MGDLDKMISILNRGQLIKLHEKDPVYLKNDPSDHFYLVVFGTLTLYQLQYNQITEEEYRLPI